MIDPPSPGNRIKICWKEKREGCEFAKIKWLLGTTHGSNIGTLATIYGQLAISKGLGLSNWHLNSHSQSVNYML